MKRIRLGHLHADNVTLGGAVDRIAELVAAGRGGYVVTPNVDHVVLAEHDASLRQAYAEASLSLVDGMPLVWLSRIMRHPLPERVAGADLRRPLLARAVREGWRVYLLGGAPGVGEAAAARLVRELPALQIVGIDAPPVGFERDAARCAEALSRLRSAKPNVVLFALGCPKQERLMHAWRAQMAPAVGLGIGAGLDFLAGRVRRAPRWVARIGFEWAFRLAQEPRRLAHRYLVRDRAIFGIAWRMLQMPEAQRVIEADASLRDAGTAA